MGCRGGSITTNPDDWAQRSFQTWLPGDALHKDGYEGLGRVMCYSNIKYSSDRKSATVDIRCRQHDSIKTVEFDFGSGFQSNNEFKVDSSFSNELPIKV